MIGQTTNQANNPPKDGAILPPTIDVDKHELTEPELADMTPMRLAERIQQMEEAFKLLGPVEDVLTPGEVSFIETPKVEVADTVGAGDSLTGAFVASILKGKSVREAHELAVKVSAFVCTQNGAMPVLPDEFTK